MSTFIGALSAFIFSIFLFYLTEKWKNKLANKNLGDCLQKEIDYNIIFLEKYKEDYEKMLRQISANDKQIYTVFRFEKLQRLFLQEAFNKGILYKHLNTEQISEVDNMINFFGYSTNNLAWSILNGFKGNTSTQSDTLRKFEWDKDQIDKYINLLKTLKEKFKKIK
ncbi:MAG: hypothetical protein WC435_03570 [Candidatus Paceibacterota bacterium]